MSIRPFTLEGTYFDGRQPVGQSATLKVVGANVALEAGAIRQTYRLAALKLSPRIASADRFIAFPDGGQLQCADRAELDQLPQKKAEGFVAFLENNVAVAVFGTAVIAVSLIVGYTVGLPAAAERVAAKIPIEVETELGRSGLEWLDDNEWLVPSALNNAKQAQIQKGFNELIQGLPYAKHYQLEFREAPKLGPNAFALPGGTVIITDELVKIARTPDEILAVLAHEIGHVERRHTLKMVLQDSVVAIVVASVTGDAASFGAAALPTILAQRSYSRQFETESDDFAFALLKQHGRSPNSFADVMMRMYEKQQAKLKGERGASDFLSTHPLTAERIERARQAAGKD